MIKVICTRPNASEKISGVAFTKCPEGMISEKISQEMADTFLAIEGYHVEGQVPGTEEADKDAPPEKTVPAPAGKKPAKAAKAAPEAAAETSAAAAIPAAGAPAPSGAGEDDTIF